MSRLLQLIFAAVASGVVLLPAVSAARAEMVFSGYTLDEIRRIPGSQAFLEKIDVLIAGRYQADQRVASGLIGSANKTIHLLSSRYTISDLEAVPQAEIILSPEGEIILSGIDPLKW